MESFARTAGIAARKRPWHADELGDHSTKYKYRPRHAGVTTEKIAFADFRP